MIPRYGKLNKTYTEITSGDGLSFEKQKFIHDFYKEYEDTQTFEKALISLMLETEGTHFSILLNSLKREIENNISMYNTCKEFFDRLDIEHICRQHERCHDRDIERQMQITNEYYRVSGNTTVRKRSFWKRGTNGASRNTTGRKPNWMNYTQRRNRQGRKPCNT